MKAGRKDQTSSGKGKAARSRPVNLVEENGRAKSKSVADEKMTRKASPAESSSRKKSRNLSEDWSLEMNQLKTQLQELTVKVAEYEDLIKRQQAEFDNYRKRVKTEREDLVKYASDKLLKDFISIYDHFDKALSIDSEDESLKKYIQGFQLIKEQLDKMLEDHGVVSSTSVGDLFNPDHHKAIQVEDEGGSLEQVKEVYQKGYFLHDRLLRESVVKVHRVEQ